MLPVQFHLHGLCHFQNTLKNSNRDHETADMEKNLRVTLFTTFLLVTMIWPFAFAGASRSGLSTV